MIWTSLSEMITVLKAHYGQNAYVVEVSNRRLDPEARARGEFEIVKRERECIEDMYEELMAKDELASAARVALSEMRNTVAPRNSFTEAVDRLDAAVSKYESRRG